MSTPADARRLLAAVQDDPAEVVAAADAALARHGGRPDDLAGCVIRWARGAARLELDEVAAGRDDLAAAAATASVLGDAELEAEVRMSLAMARYRDGDTAAGVAELDAAEAHLPAHRRGRLVMQRALVLLHGGQLAAASAGFDQAAADQRAHDDRLGLARTLANRGVLAIYEGDLHAAAADLADARELAVGLGLRLLAAGAGHNLGYVRSRQGDLPGALALLGEARARYAELVRPPGRVVAALEVDLCEVRLLAGLTAEAVEAAERAVASLGASGNRVGLAEAELLLADALVQAGRSDEGADAARRAAEGFERSGRGAWTALARYAGLRAATTRTEHEPVAPSGLQREAADIAALLDEHGWQVEALHVRTFVARMALAAGDAATARSVLAAADGARRRGPVALRAQAWHAVALQRVADDDRTGALRAARAGLELVARHQDSLGASELRVRAAAHGADLARLGLRLAAGGGSAADLLRWSERWRARSLRRPSVRPPRDPATAADLEHLRQLHLDARAARLEGGDAPGTGQVATLEARIVERARTASGGVGAGAAPDPRLVRARLGPRVLVSFVELDRQLLALVVDATRCRRVDLGPVAPVVDDLAALHLAVRRLTRAAGGGRPAPDGVVALHRLAGRLQARLLDPLRLGDGGDAEVVVVPTGALHGLPWGALPAWRGRPVLVAPSVATWLDGAPPPGGGVLLVGGPDLPGATSEVVALSARHPGAEVLVGAAATGRAVLAAMGRAGVAHVAAHGDLRPDNPSFSALRLADGPLTVLDLEQLPSVPGLVVLPACGAAAHAVSAGDELVGLAAALLPLGVGHVVAPLTSVPDDATRALMVAFHDELLAGRAPAAALAGAAAPAFATDDPAALVAATAFTCIGRDLR